MKRFLLLVFSLLMLAGQFANAQSIINPADPITRYVAGSAVPTQPAWGTIGKWVCTNQNLGWDVTSFKAYIYNGMQFRVKFPKTYTTAADGKVYPAIVFWHGKGEAGAITDNEYQLYHGGKNFAAAVDAGTFDGYLIYPQNIGGYFGPTEYSKVMDILNYMLTNNKVDANRIMVNGLSAGGSASWEFMQTYPQVVAGSIPMSSASTSLPNTLNSYKYTPVWLFQGGQDGAPSAYTAEQAVATIKAAGANITFTEYPTLGHDVWDNAWSEPNFWPFMNAANILTPYPLFGRYQFCVGDAINITAGIPPGFSAYEWKRNDTIIAGATTNSINITSLGTYAVHVKRTSAGAWSDWSSKPLVVAIKAPTQTPPITTAGLQSNVLPAPDGKTSVTLRLPSTYIQFQWINAGTGATVGTDSLLTVSTTGRYVANVKELYGCTSNNSVPFLVVPANGAHAPDAISSLTSTTLSKTSLKLDWSDKPNPLYNETFFEVYRAAQTGGPYTLIAKTNSNIVTYTDSLLQPSTAYYYLVRPISDSGAAPVSVEVKGTTQSDVSAPTAPTLSKTISNSNSVTLKWIGSKDDVGVTGYDIYVNGVKTYNAGATDSTLTAFGLTANQSYTFYVVAKDASGNVSSKSNQLSATASQTGFNYRYYEGTWSKLPNFNTLTPVATGMTTNIDITPRKIDDYFGFVWEGYIRIPADGVYTFATNSDDGSNFYFNTWYDPNATPLVNNDGGHSATTKSATITLTAGVYKICATYFEINGGQSMALQWSSPAIGSTTLKAIPDSVITQSTAPTGLPIAPCRIAATSAGYNKVLVNWADSSSNETGFEIYRSTDKVNYAIVGSVASNVTSFTDAGLTPATRYYYGVKAINAAGSSPMSSSLPYLQVLTFDNVVTDLSPNNNAAVLSAATYSTAITKQGVASLFFNGTGAYATIGGTATGYLHDSITTRTIAGWIQPTVLDNTQRVIVDMGGAANGLAVRINNSKLEVGIADTRDSLRRAVISVPFTALNVWSHFAVVYNLGRLQLYVNGAVVKDTVLGTRFSPISATTLNSRLAGTSTDNAFNANGTAYKGYLDYFTVINQALSASDITKLYNGTLPIYTVVTDSLPVAPAVPTLFTATAAGANKITLNWKNSGTAKTSVEIYRSQGDTSSFRLSTKLDSLVGGATTTFNDTALFANQQYFYKIRAINVGGNSVYTAVANATTLNTKPKFTAISNMAVRYGTTTHIPVVATDADGDALTYTAANLPAFATFVSAAGNTYIDVNPDVTQQNVYQNLTFYVNDGNGGKDTTSFTLTVNDNYAPIIGSISDTTVSEGDHRQVTISLADNHNSGKTFTWTAISLPSFVTLTPGTDSTVIANVNPGFSAAGTYTIQLQVTDSRGGVSSVKTFPLTVLDKDPADKYYIRFKNSTVAPAPWNNVTSAVTNNLVNNKGVTTSASFSVLGSWYDTMDGGLTTGSNTGVYPDYVLRDCYYFGQFGYYFNTPDTIQMSIGGLDTAKTYSLKFLQASNWWAQSDNGTSIVIVNGVAKSQAVQNNTSNLSTFDGVKPNAAGQINFGISKTSTTQVGYLNSIEVTGTVADGTAPATPGSLKVTLPGGIAQLNWNDSAYNENNYKVYRSSDSLGTYALVNTLAPNTTAYNDSTAVGNHTYFYKVSAINDAGTSLYSNIASVYLPNKVPAVDSLVNISLKAGNSISVLINGHDDPQDTLKISTSGLPVFGSLVDNGNGTGTLTFTPSNSNLGTYTMTVNVKDNHGATGTRTFNISVSDKNTTLTYINFAETTPAPAPWNNIVGYPTSSGVKLANAVDELGNTTTMSLGYNEAWSWAGTNGANTVENTGIYPDVVLKTSIYESSSNVRTLNITGLASGKKYNFVFFNSLDFGVDATTYFFIGTDTVKLNASYNTAKTMQINGVVPVNGVVNIGVKKGPTNAINAYLNALVVEAYADTLSLVSPGSLRAKVISDKKIALFWADRANNETGYEVWRSASADAGYSLIGSVAANVREYSDSSLTPNTRYYYKVRAVQNSTYSDFSNNAYGVTYALNLYVHFAQTSLANVPWNNTTSRPSVGPWISNLKDINGNTTNVGISVLSVFEDRILNGMNTGNNSGVYPDAVLAEYYAVYPGKTATLKVSGLNQTMAYDLTFLNSDQDYTELTSKFTVNGSRYTLLNAALNTKGTATLYNVTPDSNGEIRIDINLAYANTYIATINALVLQGHNLPVDSASSPNANAALLKTKTSVIAPAYVGGTKESSNSTIQKITAFPNPFVDHVNVDITLGKASDLYIDIYDITGRLMHREVRQNTPQGRTLLQVNTAGKIQAPGFYMLRVLSTNGEYKVVKLVKH